MIPENDIREPDFLCIQHYSFEAWCSFLKHANQHKISKTIMRQVCLSLSRTYPCVSAYEFWDFHFLQILCHSPGTDTETVSRQCGHGCDWRVCIWLWTVCQLVDSRARNKYDLILQVRRRVQRWCGSRFRVTMRRTCYRFWSQFRRRPSQAEATSEDHRVATSEATDDHESLWSLSIDKPQVRRWS